MIAFKYLNFIKSVLLLVSSTLAITVQAQTSWQIQEGYSIAFSGKKAEGTFSGLVGNINFDPQQLDLSAFEVSVEVSSIATGNKTKDKHARGKKWFGAETFPRIYFRSNRIQKTSDGYLAQGELEMHGVKKELTLPFTFTLSGDLGLFKGTMAVSRKDFGIMGNLFGFMVGETFEVKLSVPVQKITGL